MTILTKERRNALGSLITNWLSEQDEDGRMLDTFDYFDVDKIDALIDEAIAPAIADAVGCATAALPHSDATQAPLSNEQRDALQWAADRAHVESLGKSICGVEGRRWRILLDLLRNSSVAPAAAESQS